MQLLLKDIADILVGLTLRGKDASRKSESKEGLPLLRISDLNANGQIEIQSPHLIDPTSEQRRKYGIAPEDIVFANRGARLTAAIAPNNINAIASGQLFLIRPKGNKVAPQYLWAFLNLRSTQERLASMAKGTHVKGVSKAALAQLEVPIPMQHHQASIAEYTILVHREQKILQRLAQLKRTRFEEAVRRAINTTSPLQSLKHRK